MIELLVVVIVIGVLAAIAVPNFLLQQSKAHDAGAKSAARVAMSALETYSTERDGYTGATVADLEQIEPALSDAVIVLDPPTSSSYHLESTSPPGSPSGTFMVDRASDGSSLRSCTPAGKGGCPSNGRW